MDTPDIEHGRVYFKQFGAERVKGYQYMWESSKSLGKSVLWSVYVN